MNEFKEFENPEAKDYDLKVRDKSLVSRKVMFDNTLNTDEGIDLNDLTSEFHAEINDNPGTFEINKYGEIIRIDPDEEGHDLNHGMKK